MRTDSLIHGFQITDQNHKRSKIKRIAAKDGQEFPLPDILRMEEERALEAFPVNAHTTCSA